VDMSAALTGSHSKLDQVAGRIRELRGGAIAVFADLAISTRSLPVWN
jgi:hypothetical protein